MIDCAEQHFNQDFQLLQELLAKVQTVEPTDNLSKQLSNNRILFKKLKALLKQDYFLLLFFSNEVINLVK